ncbi:MAG: hypothetical protein A2023_07240 [Sulfuricurvum sp. GWF2_44_89]|uniref:Multi-ubiquitin domain-containing protein n=1 Tax=Sulfuricurvum kujiense TaxID=148813 RepID=A0A2D3WJG9_9BACT|nr:MULTISPECIES: multiubiquitin domain-containing protein [Sulfuricurvum]OHD78270.1 MAG: hypothetical protein A2023_07240 [Sulfuricurvum sp. GWF2_44_89]OHD91577.1 MAG: hypothetical protein A2517_07180 [Sulfuricurvum sp. RIFOXYD12_FULL_44_77]OHD94135.1 MAG: hypothetical protein A2552_01685 [Sulfuricurvum sp. RIFOXYD2_FULL_44_160]DAB38877.1 MAG TPA: hypothetical protein CFH83_03855 [Sulfuricurvum kujiense]
MSQDHVKGHLDDAPGQNKEYSIVINGVQVVVDQHKLCYKDILQLQNLPYDANNPYIVKYDRGHGNAEGSMDPSDCIPIKDGMVFNVTPTNKS